jgi:RNA polymerase sigma factor (TIGR02999 family)
MNDVPGPGQPAGELFDALYAELKRIAHRQLAARGGTLQTTGLVHEAWLKLAHARVEDEKHLLNLASRAMRQVLLDLARDRGRDKRGNAPRHEPLTERIAVEAAANDSIDVLALEQCLQRLEQAEPRLAQVVELHFYGGLSFPEMSRVLNVTERTLFRDWRTARALIHADLTAAGA